MKKQWTIALSVALAVLAVAGISRSAMAMTEDELKAKITEATKDLKDISMVGAVTFKNKKALAKIDGNYSRLYDFNCATVTYKEPDKMRMDGKLGMVRFEYIINGATKIIRAPSIRINKKEEYPSDPAKLQDALDMGLITSSMWRSRKIEIVDDPDATAAGDVKVRLRWPKGDMILYAYIDAKDFWLKRFEKRDSQGKLLFKVVYSEPTKAGGVIWVPTKVEVFSADGDKAGTSQYSDIKVNAGVSDSLF
jgi:outer membrane lipoprotein-sorting protein